MSRYKPGKGLEVLVHDSFIGEITALKPGNVSQYADGHGMSFADFVASADVTTPILCNETLCVGEKVFYSVEATKNKVDCNTNLGMILLFSPLIKSFESKSNDRFLQSDLEYVLKHLTNVDAELVYKAISLANPGGLGRLEQHDVNNSPDISLLEAMTEAADRDLIARQYISNYEDVYKLGLNCLSEFDKRWNSVEWAAVACYLTYMANFPDSHIRRKFGDEIAKQVQKRTVSVMEQFKKNNNPAKSKSSLLEYDKELKDSNINPGTSADLTAASLLLYGLTTKQN
ncbi:MAG TPA: triphosphoribosyl-dephospho-CoA synthase [Dehalococcoidia bacterium]|nr:triphosphoribosyl-dephospho-CoA synthase [Dehalococcoidia bacterium]